MTDVIVFHHAQGLTDGVKAFADELRAAGHTVHTPDLHEGRTFATLPKAMGYVRETGFDTIIGRGQAAAEALPRDVVYVGFSMGVLPAQYRSACSSSWARRPRARSRRARRRPPSLRRGGPG